MIRTGRSSKLLQVVLVLTSLVAGLPGHAESKAQTRPSKSAEHPDIDAIARQLLELPAPPPASTGLDPADGEPDQETKDKRPSSFYDPAKPPPDDAPLGDLLAYWARAGNHMNRSQIPPTPTVRERLLAACEADPGYLGSLLDFVPDNPETAARVIKVYETVPHDEEYSEDWHKRVQKWLRFNTAYYLDELAALAAMVSKKAGYIDHADALAAWVKQDRTRALPLVRSLAESGEPRLAALAIALLYRDAIAAKELSAEGLFRTRLQAIAADRNAPGWARYRAIDELSNSEWSGRDEWYLAQFSDESLVSLSDGIYGMSPLTTLFDRDPDKWIPVMARLVESKDRATRRNAGNCLVKWVNDRHPRRDAILPLLRWLSDPDWLDLNGTYRAWFIQAMNHLNLPESIPGLIWIVENEKYYRQYAAKMLAFYHDGRAVPALKRALATETDGSAIQQLINALVASGGFTEAEQLAAIEAYAAKLTTPEGRKEVTGYRGYNADPLPLTLNIGIYLAREKDVAEGLARAVLARADGVKRTDPGLANALLEVAQNWQTKLIDLDLVRRIGDGTADAQLIADGLERRDKLVESVGTELRSISGNRGLAPSVVAALLSDEAIAQNVITTNDEGQLIVLLACARLVRLPLPLGPVGALLRSRSGLLALAAQKYLLAEDSAEARRILWERFPDQGFVTGWRENLGWFVAGIHGNFDSVEERLRQELFQKNGAPTEIFALNYYGEPPVMILRLYDGKGIFTLYEGKTRYHQRTLSRDELERFRLFLATSEIENSGPRIGRCHHNCTGSEFLMLTKAKGRRVFSYEASFVWEQSLSGFHALLQPGARTRYWLEDHIPGAELLAVDDSLAVRDVRMSDGELIVQVEREPAPDEERALAELERSFDEDEEGDYKIEDQRRDALRAGQARARLSWRHFKKGKLGLEAPAPELPAEDLSRFEIDTDRFPSNLNGPSSVAPSRDFVVLSGGTFNLGLWKKALGQPAVRLTQGGWYANPVVSPDGRWVVAAKAETNWGVPNGVIRLNLKTRTEYAIDLPPAQEFEPVALLTRQNRILLRRARGEFSGNDADGPAIPEFYLLDAATGQTQRLQGSFAPFMEEGSRGLQASSSPDEVWAAIPDRNKNETQVGRYHLDRFSFHPVLTVPSIAFESQQMWVDEANAVMYVVYEGQLLRLPFTPSVRVTPAK